MDNVVEQIKDILYGYYTKEARDDYNAGQFSDHHEAYEMILWVRRDFWSGTNKHVYSYVEEKCEELNIPVSKTEVKSIVDGCVEKIISDCYYDLT